MDNLLITGGSGTIGNAIVTVIMENNPSANITIFSRSESRQAAMRAKFPNLTYVLGDIRDYQAINNAIAGHKYVIHAAAMKRIPECEEQPEECYKTNVMGSLNVIRACNANNVKVCIGLSTDKACQPVTAYGASKLMMEKAFQGATGNCIFTMVRYGNVVASTGSVLQIWEKQHQSQQTIQITKGDMTRFWMTPHQAVDLILRASQLGHGMILVPKMKSCSIGDLATWAFPNSYKVEVGLRSMERLHEFLVSPDELVEDIGDCFIVGRGEMGELYSSFIAPRFEKDELMELLVE